MFLGVPGTIRAPHHTFFVYVMYMELCSGHHKSGHHGTISAAFSKNGHHKKAKINPRKPLIYAGLLLCH
jgi:hypothetical protein